MRDFSFHRLADDPAPTPTRIDVPLPIFGVLTLLPPPGTAWPDVEKAKFLAALGTVLDLVYPAQVPTTTEPK
jgi:hypothetical protein